MDLTNGQYEARKQIFQWFRDGGDEPFFLAGYAGSGKTTLIKHLIGEARGNIAVLAPTNKAAKVLRGKGVPQAQTIHSYLYGEPIVGKCDCGSQDRNHDKRCPALKLEFLPRGMTVDGMYVEEMPPTLVIVDEASMVNEKLARDIIAKGVPVLAVGDPGQLPPVEGAAGFATPTYVLSEITRQAADNPIIRLADDVRHGKPLRPGHYGSAVEITKLSLNHAGFDTDDWDQILTWRHVSRCMYNRQYREILGIKDPLPTSGEEVMFKSTHKELGVANGDVFEIADVNPQPDRPALDLRIKLENNGTCSVSAWKLGFGGAEEWRELDTMEYKYKRFHARVTFNYAITTHSAQGSEWPAVIIAKDGNSDKRWMYTALTRARERALVCLGKD